MGLPVVWLREWQDFVSWAENCSANGSLWMEVRKLILLRMLPLPRFLAHGLATKNWTATKIDANSLVWDHEHLQNKAVLKALEQQEKWRKALMHYLWINSGTSKTVGCARTPHELFVNSVLDMTLIKETRSTECKARVFKSEMFQKSPTIPPPSLWPIHRHTSMSSIRPKMVATLVTETRSPLTACTRRESNNPATMSDRL